MSRNYRVDLVLLFIGAGIALAASSRDVKLFGAGVIAAALIGLAAGVLEGRAK